MASFDELIIFFKKHRSPTAMCLIARAADNLINFQAFFKKSHSTFDLLEYCCRIFQQQFQTDFVSNRELFKCCSKLRLAAELTVLFREKKGCQFSVRHVSDIGYSQSLQSIYCGSQAVEHSHAVLLSPIQTLAASN